MQLCRGAHGAGSAAVLDPAYPLERQVACRRLAATLRAAYTSPT